MVLELLGGDGFTSVAWIILLFVFFLLYPRLMLTQMIWKIEKTARDLEMMSETSKKFLVTSINKKPTKELRQSVDRFFEFFMISPASLDPYGVVKKFDQLVQDQRYRFKEFVDSVAPEMNEEQKANIGMGFAGGISLYELTKIVRHLTELAKKTKSLQIAMILQMQLPLIERIAKAVYKGTFALAKGYPIGDGVAPYVVASLNGNNKMKLVEEDVLASQVKINGKKVLLVKARGPGGRIGRPDYVIERLMKKHKVSRIITIDAAAKLEGEKTGSVAEGVGVAMGGIGVERSKIEDVSLGRKIPVDSIIVKMSQEEAITPMRKAIKDALPEVREAIHRSLKSVKPGSYAMIVGVGNTSGIGNDAASVKKMEEWVDRHEKKMLAIHKKSKGKDGLDIGTASASDFPLRMTSLFPWMGTGLISDSRWVNDFTAFDKPVKSGRFHG